MSEVKALFPIGKTQWRKWDDSRRTAFNEAQAAGMPFLEAVDYVNELKFEEATSAPKPEDKPAVRATRAKRKVK